jgi:hypothetical protein
MKGLPHHAAVSFMVIGPPQRVGQFVSVRAAYIEEAPNLREARRAAYDRFGKAGHWGYVSHHDDNGEAVIVRRWAVADDVLPPPHLRP